MFERPHSRKVKIAEGTVEVKKGEKIEGGPAGGGSDAPLRGNEKDAGEDEEKKD
jgi:hypothetical protein